MKMFTQYLWKSIKRYYNDNEKNQRLSQYYVLYTKQTIIKAIKKIVIKLTKKRKKERKKEP